MQTPFKDDPLFKMLADVLFEKVIQKAEAKKPRGRKKGSKNKSKSHKYEKDNRPYRKKRV